MKVTHTPGPWRVGKKYVTDIYPNDGGMLVARVMTGGISNNKSYANARLIAAAPELLEALMLMVFDEQGNEWRDSKVDQGIWDDRRTRGEDIAREAIAKATGDAS